MIHLRWEKREIGKEGLEMNILLIGNGFDLAHDLPTRYLDFYMYSISHPAHRIPWDHRLSSDTKLSHWGNQN